LTQRQGRVHRDLGARHGFFWSSDSIAIVHVKHASSQFAHRRLALSISGHAAHDMNRSGLEVRKRSCRNADRTHARDPWADLTFRVGNAHQDIMPVCRRRFALNFSREQTLLVRDRVRNLRDRVAQDIRNSPRQRVTFSRVSDLRPSGLDWVMARVLRQRPSKLSTDSPTPT
jgi:hypothetical protein